MNSFVKNQRGRDLLTPPFPRNNQSSVVARTVEVHDIDPVTNLKATRRGSIPSGKKCGVLGDWFHKCDSTVTSMFRVSMQRRGFCPIVTLPVSVLCILFLTGISHTLSILQNSVSAFSSACSNFLTNNDFEVEA